VVTAEQAAQHFVARETSENIHESLKSKITTLWLADTCVLRECQTCGFGFADPFRAGDSEFYALAYPRVGYPTNKWEFSQTLRALNGRSLSGPVLEVGAGYGLFLDQLTAMHTSAQPVAVEYHDDAAAEIRKRGYDVRQQDFRDGTLDDLKGRLNAAFAFQVLEHMDDPEAAFARWRELLLKGAPLFIAVPNVTAIKYAENNSGLIDMPPNHIGRWTVDALKLIGYRNKFELVRHETEPFDAISFLKTDCLYSYFRRAQQRGTLANASRSQRLRPWGRVIEGATAALYIPSRLPIWARHFNQRLALGSTLWVEFCAR